jgi:hypothetical protein
VGLTFSWLVTFLTANLVWAATATSADELDPS